MKEEIKKLIDDYWRFDDNQRPTSSWHEKQDLLKEIDKLLSSYISKDKVMEIAELSMGVGYGMHNVEKELGEIETDEKIEKLREILKKEYGL